MTDPPPPRRTPHHDDRLGVWCVVVAAGAASRFGRPKQFERLCGRRVVDWSVAAAAGACEGVVLVVPPAAVEHERRLAPPAVRVCAGGATRSESVRAGLAAVPEHAEVILVHDAARPLAPARLFSDVITAVRAGASGAVPGVPVVDTVKEIDDPSGGVRPVGRTLPRERLVAVQTPQGFDAVALRHAHAVAAEATDDASLVEAAGATVVLVPGDERNLKITHLHDLAAAAAVLGAGSDIEGEG